ncbi:MAG: two-component system response regulator [Solimicrobium sp.]|jgi:two-component system response regulator DctR|nr:two-component system response regulator [Solimicrobium sp.]
MNDTKTISIVDDDEAIQDSLRWLFSSRGHAAKCFSSGAEFLKNYSPEEQSCIILDVRMPEMSGIEVFDVLHNYSYCPPVLFLTGHGDIPMAVNVLKNGASEFIQKPFRDNEIVDLVESYIIQDHEKRNHWHLQQKIRQQLSQLTCREQEVMELMLKGRLNKQVADELDIAIKTVEVHRSRILEKMNVKTALALASALRNAQI